MPILSEISGRTTDFITAQDGTVMHGLALIYILRDVSGIQEFKIVQESIDLTRIILKIDDQFDSDCENNIKAEFKKRLGADVNVSIEKVKEIPAEKSGKFRYVISKLN